VKRLVVVRHAKAAKGAAGVRDADRPLAPRGERDAPEMARRLVRAGIVPDALVASPARRTGETARLIARELDFPWREIAADRRIYEADAGGLLEVVREAEAGRECLMLIGHNPGVTELAQALLPGFREELPTAALVVVDLPVDTWAVVRPGTGSLRLYDFPKREGG
jgi:phosphohistidine phosphatase